MREPAGMDFWFAIGRTYSFLTVQRIETVARNHSVAVRWRPFNLRTITREMNNSPFAGKPVKAAYMWRDIQRRAAMYDLTANVPAPYPIAEYDLANRVAVVGMREGWGPAYVKETYRRWMADGQEPGSEPNLSSSLMAAGQDPARVGAAARESDVAREMTRATDEARHFGIFGSPSFSVGGEIFWGDDRLEDAVSWAKHGCLLRSL